MGGIDRALIADEINNELREKTGKVGTYSVLTNFLYLLMREVVPPGEVHRLLLEVMHDKQMVHENGGPIVFTNGYLADYAHFIADKLTE